MKGFQRLISGIMVVCLMLSLIPVQAFAEEPVTETAAAETTEAFSVPTEGTSAPAETEAMEEITAATEETIPEGMTITAAQEAVNSVVDSGTCGDGLTWVLDDAGTLTISGTGEMKDFTYDQRPPWYGNKYDNETIDTVIIETGVSSIGENAFNFCRELTSVSLSNTVTTIGKSAFSGCEKLEYVIIPESVTRIGSMAFSNSGLVTVIIPDSVENLEGFSFAQCKKLTSVHLPENIRVINDQTFDGCSQLESIVIPNAATAIGSCAFRNCSSLESVTIGNGVKQIGLYAFSGCTSLTTISISNQNEYFEVKNNVLFSEDLKTLVVYPEGRSPKYVIPEHVSIIGTTAFAKDSDLYSVMLPDTIVTIEDYAFVECTALSQMIIPSCIESVGNMAFSGCFGLTAIIFMGDAPVFAEYSSGRSLVFQSVTATAYYPEDNSTWTSDVMQNYGGTITWVPYDPASGIPGDQSLFRDYFDNHSITINGSGSAYAYYQAKPNQNICWETETTSGSGYANEDGVFRVALGSFDTPGTYYVTVNITEVDGEVPEEGELDATVTVTPVVFSQEWEASVDASVGASIGMGAGIKIGPIEGEATLGKAGLEAEGESALSISREYSENGESLKLLSDRKFEGGVSLKSGITADALDSKFEILSASAKAMGSMTGTYGIQIENYSASDSAQQRAVGTYFLGEILLANPNHLFLKEFYNKMAETVYVDAGCIIIEGSGVGISGSISGSVGAFTINGNDLFNGVSGSGKASVSMSETTKNNGTSEKEVSYKTEANLSVLSGIGGVWDDSLLAADFLGKDTSVTAKYGSKTREIEATSLSASVSGVNSFVLGENYTMEYDQYNFRGDALTELVGKAPNYNSWLKGSRFVLTGADLADMADTIAESGVPIPHSTLVKDQMLYSLPLELGGALGVGVDLGVTLSYLESTEHTKTSGYVVGDLIWPVSESDDLSAEVNAGKRDLSEILTNVMKSLANDVKNFFKKVSGAIKDGVESAWGWIKKQSNSVKDWVVSLTYADDSSGRNAYAHSYQIAAYGSRDLQTNLGAGITGIASSNFTITKASTIGRPIQVSVEEGSTGEEVTDLSEEPLEFTIRYVVEDLEAAGLNVYSPAYLDGEIAMYRYSDEGDFYEYIGGMNDLEAMTVTAEIVKPGQYVLAVDSCAPSLESLDISDFRSNPTITAQVDDLSGLDMSGFEFALDGEKKVWDENVADHYDTKLGRFTYTVPEAEALTEGEHTMLFILADTTGNSETYEYTFNVDLTAPVIEEVTVTGFTNAGSAVEIRVQVSDANLTGVYAVFSKLLPDGTWSDEVSTPMGDMGNGLWGLDYEGDGSSVKICVKAVDIAENSVESGEHEAHPFVEGIVISQNYLALQETENTQLNAEVSPSELSAVIQWTVEKGGENIVSVDETGNVTALSEGTAYVIVSVSDGEVTLTDRCRVDVAEAVQLHGIQLSTSKLTTELYSTDYAEFDILLKLPQNYAATAAATAAVPENKGVAITSAKFTDPELADLFDLVTLDDRTVAVVPTEAALADAKAVQSKYVGTVTVTVQGKEYTSEALTLTVKKTLPKLKATIPAFNNFWSGQTQEITVTGATVTGITCENLPDWLSLYAGELSLNENVPAKGGSAKLTLLVETEEWAVPVETALAVKCSYKAPGLKLSASSVQLAGVNSDGVKLQLLSKDKKLTLNDLGVSGISAPEGYSISNYNDEDGTFVIKAESGFQPGKINLEVGFHNTSETVAIPLTVKVVPVTLKLAPSSITLNSGTGDSAAVTVTATPADYRLTAPDIRILDAAKQDKTDSGELKLSCENGRLSISTTDLTPDNAKYTLFISAEGGKEASLKISTTNAEPTMKLKANGNLDLSFSDRKIGLTTTFKNHSGGNLKAIDYTVTESSGKTILDEDSKAIRLIKDGADLFVQLKDTTGINIKNTYTLNLKLTLADDSVLESSVKIPVKQTAVNLKLSANKLTLNKAIDDKATVTVTCATKDYNFTEPVWTLLDSKGREVEAGILDISWTDGKLTVATTDATPYGGSYKLQIAAEEGAKAVALAIVIPAEAKSKVTGTLKATGNLDVIRDGTALTVTPTWKNCNEAEREETLTIRNGNGEDVTAQFVITEENGKYILTRGTDLDHTQKYTATLTATFTNGETAVATGPLKLKMGSAKLTLKADSTTLFANDKHSRVNISFASADSTLNKVAKVTLDPKLANQFELFDYGNGQYAIGFKDGAVPAKLTSANISLNVWLEGNETTKANASVKVKLIIVR